MHLTALKEEYLLLSAQQHAKVIFPFFFDQPIETLTRVRVEYEIIVYIYIYIYRYTRVILFFRVTLKYKTTNLIRNKICNDTLIYAIFPIH